MPFYKRQWLGLPFGSPSGTKVKLDNGVFVEFDFNGNAVTAIKEGEAKHLATLERANNSRSIHLFKGKIHGSTFEIDVDRHWLSGNTKIVVVHHPSGRNVTLKPFGQTAFNVWPGFCIQKRPFGPWAIWRKKGDPRQDDLTLRDAFILHCEQEYEAVGQVLVAILLTLESKSSWD